MTSNLPASGASIRPEDLVLPVTQPIDLSMFVAAQMTQSRQ